MPILQPVAEVVGVEMVALVEAVEAVVESVVVEVEEAVVKVKAHLAVCAEMHPVLRAVAMAVVVAPPVGLQIAVLSAVVLGCSNFYE